ncbi:MAG TPA: adenylyl-sulfate kinase [Calditrichia bacterium]|nr:adenylyl-sulfate kinase [Calditrichota bacterium]HQV30510.1 adenylyl-sulfate kinase [Calditrichia bacterium]
MKQKATNITWHEGNIKKTDRERLNGQRGVCLWFTGLSGSGKSVIANQVQNLLFEKGHRTYVLDGDNIRFGLNKDLGFSPQDRTENIRRIGEVAKLFVDAGMVTGTAFISPYREDRDTVRQLMPEGDFLEVYVKCDLEVCEQRDPKGLYKKARAGEIPNFTGISAPYEAPENPELVVDTSVQDDITKNAQIVIDFLEEKGYLEAPEAAE